MSEFFPLLGNWFWFVVAGLLLILELLAPGVFFIWLAIPAAAVGVLDLMFNMGWQAEVIVFSLLSVASVYGGRQFLARRNVFDSAQPNLNRRMYEYVGSTYVLDRPIAEGRGHLSINSTLWEVEGPDLPAGTRVKVTGVNGLRLKVAAA
ncbi:MAG TPA: NfeD family protein [Aestuariivirga sp.]|nr:NfeD family protein [Aestuariivirga sp.]